MRDHFPTIVEGRRFMRVKGERTENNIRETVVDAGEAVHADGRTEDKRATADRGGHWAVDGGETVEEVDYDGHGVLCGSRIHTKPVRHTQMENFMRLIATLRQCPDQPKVRDFFQLTQMTAALMFLL
ncbi:unnamed protein product [Amoebophrya sp. A25]|nr:unnamed protein product [Amoebophrya sp. A25]|eukprot:GSA25T00021707001.1